ncbi:hypothetical protein L873DRAFT_1704303, partial [Choiromyces venosus 120613-1]
FCLNAKTIPLSLSAHSTHLLQLLDFGLFSPSQCHYIFMVSIHSIVISYEINLKKQIELLMLAQRLAFTVKNILSAWEAVGIFSFNPHHALGVAK